MQRLTTNDTGERIERVTGNTEWTDLDGAYVEVTARYIASGDSSVVLRMADESRPLTLTWGYFDGFQLGGLPRDFAAIGGNAPQPDVSFKLTIRGLKRPRQRIKVETLEAGTWRVVQEKDAQVRGLKEWISEKEGVLVFGLAGEVLLADVSVKMVKERTLFLVR